MIYSYLHINPTRHQSLLDPHDPLSESTWAFVPIFNLLFLPVCEPFSESIRVFIPLLMSNSTSETASVLAPALAPALAFALDECHGPHVIDLRIVK